RSCRRSSTRPGSPPSSRRRSSIIHVRRRTRLRKCSSRRTRSRRRSTRSRRSPTRTTSSQTRKPDFDSRAGTYDELRPQDENWWELYQLVVREADLRGQRVLDAGCGTGRFAAALGSQARVWGIDASAEMLAVARERVPHNVRLKLARAEGPPFKDGWFERVVFWLVIHLLDRPVAFREAHRVLVRGGLASAGTLDSADLSGCGLRGYCP